MFAFLGLVWFSKVRLIFLLLVITVLSKVMPPYLLMFDWSADMGLVHTIHTINMIKTVQNVNLGDKPERVLFCWWTTGLLVLFFDIHHILRMLRS